MEHIKKLLIVVAFKEEAKLVRKVLAQKKAETANLAIECDMQLCGMGPRRALEWANKTLKRDERVAVLITGFCGGLSVPTHVGDVILPTHVILRNEETAQDTTFLPQRRFAEALARRLICAGGRYKAVPLVTVDRIVESELQRSELFKFTQAEAVDMEAGAVASVCARYDHPYFVLKVVSDDATSDLDGLNEIYQRGDELSRANMGKWLLEYPVLAMKMRHNWGEAKDKLKLALSLALDEFTLTFKGSTT